MVEIVASEKDVVGRKSDIVRSLSPLVDRSQFDVRQLPHGIHYTLGVLPKGQAAGAVDNAALTRVPTKIQGIYLNYYEIWSRNAAGDQYKLNKAHLHVHRKRTREDEDKQILCLHCDLLAIPPSAEMDYRRGPHLHVMGAIPNIDRSHIALCLNDPNFGGRDMATLTQTFADAVRMIGYEIFPHYK